MAFEDAEARMQAAVFRHTSNCTVVFGDSTFRAIFNNPDATFDSALIASTPELRYPTSEGLSRDDAITIDGVPYVVATVPRRIGAGGESVASVERP